MIIKTEKLKRYREIGKDLNKNLIRGYKLGRKEQENEDKVKFDEFIKELKRELSCVEMDFLAKKHQIRVIDKLAKELLKEQKGK